MTIRRPTARTFVEAHPVGDGLLGVCHPQSPTGVGSYKKMRTVPCTHDLAKPGR
ncbi:MAG: hypothetical protein KAY21_03365 [Limnohabitans sp.]|nr:hypothetical protein [Limnohabitans sp.]